MLDAASTILDRIASNGVSARDAAAVETLRNWLECAEEGRDHAKYLGPGWFDDELGRMCARLRERIAEIDALLAAAKPN
jgi:hypothetical protein